MSAPRDLSRTELVEAVETAEIIIDDMRSTLAAQAARIAELEAALKQAEGELRSAASETHNSVYGKSYREVADELAALLKGGA